MFNTHNHADENTAKQWTNVDSRFIPKAIEAARKDWGVVANALVDTYKL
jgi:hypothetical protein